MPSRGIPSRSRARWTPASRRSSRSSLPDKVVSHHERIQAAPVEGHQGIARGLDDRLPLEVEARIENDRHAGALGVVADQRIVQFVVGTPYSLDPGCAIHMDDGGDLLR